MFQILHGINVDWMRRRRIAYMISGLMMVVSLVSLVSRGGPRYGVDFTGGTLIEVVVSPAPSPDAVRDAMKAGGFPTAEIQQRLDQPEHFIIRLGESKDGADAGPAVLGALKGIREDGSVRIFARETVGPRVGAELRGAAIKAVFLALGLILLYVGIRYDWRYAMGAVLALFHDVFITLGAFSLLDKEVTLTVVAAFLTLAGFSINDKVVVFDRIRERKQSLRRESPEKVMNLGINETLSRTIITNGTVAVTTLALFLFGGDVIHDFSFAMLVGAVIGTYSSLYVASALALELQLRFESAPPRKK
ncbi:MAG TPA: protein translocase subunit SecF [Acidobacteriota bacterium]|nr:protein translocase subunit SecF [Acidobacteriota bacterium]